jgi:prevent-host-death family protein
MPEVLARKEDRPSVGVRDARSTLGELVSRAGFGGQRIRIARNGKDVAAIIGLDDLERLEALDAPTNQAEPASVSAA